MGDYYKGIDGKEYILHLPAIKQGGEGYIYRIQGLSDYVIKLFRPEKKTEARHRKLLAMLDTPLSVSALQQITWPVDVVYNNGEFVGYVMPELKQFEELNVMYSDKYVCTLSEKITLAKNICAAINTVHEAGQVCGDLNPKNICVNPNTGHITLVDTDSYHITEKKSSRVYRCEVGLPEYLSNEIQQKLKNGFNLSNAPLPTFTKQTDLFALAVHIFALLMNGCHPFACSTNNKNNIHPLAFSQPSIVAPQPIENICNGFFPFYKHQTGLTIPKYAPDFSVLPPSIQELFIKAFVDGFTDPNQRPSAVEWHTALVNMQVNLKTCHNNKFHQYPSHNRSCPWCIIDAQMKKYGITNSVQPNNNSTSHRTINQVILQNHKAMLNYTSQAKSLIPHKHLILIVLLAVACISMVIIHSVQKKRYEAIQLHELEVKESLYAEALSLFNNGDYHDSAMKFIEIKEYKDASQYLSTKELRYQTADFGSVITFGRYNWIVVGDYEDELVLLSEKTICRSVYNEGYNDVTWENCSLRKWLNTDFYNEFSEEEKSYIQELEVPNLNNNDYNTSGCTMTLDHVVLLSLDDVSYLANSHSILSYDTSWWLRSPGKESTYAAAVYANGTINSAGYPVYYEHGVRPTIQIWRLPH